MVQAPKGNTIPLQDRVSFQDLSRQDDPCQKGTVSHLMRGRSDETERANPESRDGLIGAINKERARTGNRITAEKHEEFLDGILERYSVDSVSDVLDWYLKFVDLKVTQDYADRFYAKIMYHENNGVLMNTPGNFKRAYRLYEITGIKNSNDSDMKDAYSRQKGLDCYPNMLDYFLNKKNKDAIVAFIEKERLPVHGVVAIKMEFGMPISKEEITSTYDYVMSRYKANSKIDRLSSTILGLSNNPVLESLKQDLEKVVDQVNSMASRILSKEDVKEAREIFKEIDGVMDDISKLGLTDWKGLRVVREKLYGIQETFLGSFYHSSTPIEGQKQCLKLQKLLKEEIVPSIQNAPRSI